MWRCLLSILVFVLHGAPASAAPITYILSGTGSGDVNGTAFTDAPFTFTFFGDTSNVVPVAPQIFNNGLETVPATLEIEEFSLATLTDVGVFSNTRISSVGIQRPFLDIFIVSSPAFGTYDLRTAIGPIDGVASLPLSQGPFSTSLGEVTFDSYSDGASFEARTMAVPEPASVLLFGLGLAVVTRRFRQRRRH